MSEPVWIGIDLGTSGVKVVAARADGTIAAEAESTLQVLRPEPGHAEGDALEWEQAVRRCLGEVCGSALVPAGVGFAGQMHGAVLVDEEGTLLHAPVLWPDGRAADQAGRWARLPGEVQAVLGGPFSPGMTGPIAAWFAEHRPEIWQRCARILLPKDWIRERLVGGPVASGITDRSDGCATLLFDVATDRWSSEAVASAGISPAVLPDVLASSMHVGTWSVASGSAGRMDEAPVVAGGGDTPVSLVALERAVGGWQPGDLVINLGTGAQVIFPLAPVPQGHGSPPWHVYADCADGCYAMVAVMNAGLALSWAMGALGLDWARFAALAQSAPVGAGGTLFNPFVVSERGSLQAERGMGQPGWSGSDTDTVLLARAAAEGQAFLIRRAYDELGMAGGRVFLVGGGARDLWVQQLIASVLELPVHRLDLRSAPAMGAAALAAGPGWRIPVRTSVVEPADAQAHYRAYVRWTQAHY